MYCMCIYIYIHMYIYIYIYIYTHTRQASLMLREALLAKTQELIAKLTPKAPAVSYILYSYYMLSC